MKPTSLTANRQTKELTVVWDDGHTSVYPFSLLRTCPKNAPAAVLREALLWSGGGVWKYSHICSQRQ